MKNKSVEELLLFIKKHERFIDALEELCNRANMRSDSVDDMHENYERMLRSACIMLKQVKLCNKIWPCSIVF